MGEVPFDCSWEGVIDCLIFCFFVTRYIVSSAFVQIVIVFPILFVVLSVSDISFTISLFTMNVEYLESWDTGLSRYCSANMLRVGHLMKIAFSIVSKHVFPGSPFVLWSSYMSGLGTVSQEEASSAVLGIRSRSLCFHIVQE